MDKANAKVFNALFDEAQSVLRSKFGLELVGLRPRPDATGAAGAGGAFDLDGDAEAVPTQGGGRKKSTQSLCLRETCSDQFF